MKNKGRIRKQVSGSRFLIYVKYTIVFLISFKGVMQATGKLKRNKKIVSNRKISIRFFDDREVRAVWDWFSVLDIVAVLANQNNYAKTRNYWKYLKAKLKKENSQVVSATTQLKLLAPDGKRYLGMDNNCDNHEPS